MSGRTASAALAIVCAAVLSTYTEVSLIDTRSARRIFSTRIVGLRFDSVSRPLVAGVNPQSFAGKIYEVERRSVLGRHTNHFYLASKFPLLFSISALVGLDEPPQESDTDRKKAAGELLRILRTDSELAYRTITDLEREVSLAAHKDRIKVILNVAARLQPRPHHLPPATRDIRMHDNH